MNGFIIVYHNRETKGICVDVVEDLEQYFEEKYRLLYCQGVSEMDVVKEKVDNWLHDSVLIDDDINEKIASIIISLQWIANDYPVKSFLPI